MEKVYIVCESKDIDLFDNDGNIYSSSYACEIVKVFAKLSDAKSFVKHQEINYNLFIDEFNVVKGE